MKLLIQCAESVSKLAANSKYNIALTPRVSFVAIGGRPGARLKSKGVSDLERKPVKIAAAPESV